MRGHVAPGAGVATIRDEDDALVRVAEPGSRLCRCLRCDAWIDYEDPDPEQTTSEFLPGADELPRPKRGRALDERTVVRAISLERWVHVAFFLLLAILLVVVEFGLPDIQSLALQMLDNWQRVIDDSRPSHSFLVDWLHRIADLDRTQVGLLLAITLGYAALEGTEAFFLWRGKRWAEYLTVVASVSLMPMTVVALVEKVTLVRIGGLIVEGAIVAYLIFAKRLFGVRGGQKRLEEVFNAEVNWPEIYAHPPTRTPPVGEDIDRALGD
ncbi:MAG: DUF2127 domain-containing protein [Actinobacteria bacterium]|nr:DUF2127 domain-containing protein [Actinomycetota bacterium]